jgi:MFS-type transporter involved in bile tolerance (Atg22 family)
MISAHYLNRISETTVPITCPRNMFRELAKPFQDKNFRYFLFFTFFWNFSVFLSAPFFALYFLRELNYSYGFVALLTTISSLVDIVGMKFWGAVSDRVKNRAVIQVAGWGVVLLPSMWILVRPDDVLLPILIQVIGGGFWAGINLCLHNMNLRISPREGRVWFISAYSIIAGMGAAMAPVIAGASLSLLPNSSFGPGGMTILPLHYLFFASTLLRVVSLLMFRRVHEPQEAGVHELLSLLVRSARPLSKSAPANSLRP